LAEKKKNVKTAEDVNDITVLGTFEGECADSNITNLNGLDITREVWETVFESQEYKQAIDLGWYIGFLGHPEDPNCMDFEHACIVMKEGRIDDNGKVYGKFNLIDTPVGRIVKAFQDAGVTFGISVRGAGDIIDNSVDPESFVFRGFDLVSFPAYPEAIPEFKDVAASTDANVRKKYKIVCNAVRDNVKDLDTCESIDILQSQFAKQSDEYKMLEARKAEIEDEDRLDITDEKVEGMTQLYLDVVECNKNLQEHVRQLKSELRSSDSRAARKIHSIERIMSAQLEGLDNELDRVTASCDTYRRKCLELRGEIKSLRSSNLKYKQKINASSSEISTKESIISKLRSDLNETVNAASDMESRTSNLDAKNKKLQKEIISANNALKAAEAVIQDYQDAYANLYSNALGVRLNNISVTASTSVKELQDMINGSSKSSDLDNADPTPVEFGEDDGGLVTV